MPEYCDVAVPLPLDCAFTYRIPAELKLAAGCRVLVPFQQRRVVGIVTELHDRPSKVRAKKILEAMDPAGLPALNAELLCLGKWISEYYLAPLGEVFRTMLPLGGRRIKFQPGSQ